MSNSQRSDITALLDGVRYAAAQSGGSYLTNLFLPPQRVQELVDTGGLRVCFSSAAETGAGGAALLLLEPLPAGGQRLLFAASSQSALTQALAVGEKQWGEHIVCNLLGDAQRLAAVAEIFETQGFARHGLLRRMSRPAQPALADTVQLPEAQPKAAAPESISATQGDCRSPVLRPAVQSDYASIVSALGASFDHWSEPLPPQAEIDAAITSGEIRLGSAGACTERCVSGAGTAAGWDALLWAEQRGLVNTVRFWLRHPQSASGGVAGALLRELLANSAGKSIRLWVRADNTAAIERYRHYGFDFDAPVTLVMLGGKS